VANPTVAERSSVPTVPAIQSVGDTASKPEGPKIVGKGWKSLGVAV